jgi:hypothetical protein
MYIGFFNISVWKEFQVFLCTAHKKCTLILYLIYDPQQRLLHTLSSALNIWMSPGIILVSLSMSYARENHERPEQDLEVRGQALQSSILPVVNL